MVKAKAAPYLSRGKPARRNPMVSDSDYNIVARYGAEYRGIVQYYLLAGDVFRLHRLRWVMETSMPEPAPAVQRRVSSRGGIQVARQRIQVGMTHAGKIVTVLSEENSFRLVIDGETVRVVPRTTGREINRYKAHATRPGKAVTPCPK